MDYILLHPDDCDCNVCHTLEKKFNIHNAAKLGALLLAMILMA
jgi:hypothetical protein